MKKIDHALALAAKGFRVFPLSPGSKVPPKDFAWKAEATTDAAAIRKWWGNEPDYNVGIATGYGTIVVDADTKKGKPGLASLALLDSMDLPDSLRVATPSGGVHVYLRTPGQHRNRVDSIEGFKGIDIRSDGGYVVGPGSVLDGREYVVSSNEDIATSPRWFEDILLRDTPKHTAKSEEPLIELDLPQNVNRAVEYLKEFAPAAIEGEGGDETTYKVATRLRDFGLSKEVAFEVMSEHWNEAGKAEPPWSPEDLLVKIDNAFAYATSGWGAATAIAEFGALEIDVGESPIAKLRELAEATPPAKRGVYSISFAESAALAVSGGSEPLIEAVLGQGTFAALYGAPNSGKTFVALDIACAVASGRAWTGRDVERGAVLYVAAETGGGIHARLAALQKRKQIPLDIALRLIPCPVNLFAEQSDIQAVVDEGRRSARAGIPLRFIVIDTLAKTMGGGDENTVRDMSVYVENISRINRATGAAVMVVHHTGKDEARGMRGSSALLGAVDTEIEVKRTPEDRVGLIKCGKQRDLERFEDVRFMLERVVVGRDAKGREITSCVVQYPAAASEFEPLPLSREAQSLLDTLVAIGKASTVREWDAAHRRRVEPGWTGGTPPPGCSDPQLRRLRADLKDGYVVETARGLFRPAGKDRS